MLVLSTTTISVVFEQPSATFLVGLGAFGSLDASGASFSSSASSLGGAAVVAAAVIAEGRHPGTFA